MKWEVLPLTLSDAVDKGWTLQDKCQGGFKFAETEKENLLRLFFSIIYDNGVTP